MNRYLFRCLLFPAAAAAALFSMPSESHALFCRHLWGGRGCGPCGVQTTYRPLFGGYFARRSYGNCCSPVVASGCGTGCNPCATQVSYAPQTCFRTVCRSVPVTTFRPVTTCDPCSGCLRTAYRPTTSFVRQTYRVPFTVYRPVLAAACSPVVTRVGAVRSWQGVSSSGIVPAAYVDSCGSGCAVPTVLSAPVTTVAPSNSYAPSYTPGPVVEQGTPTPSLPADAQPATPTYNDSNGAAGSDVEDATPRTFRRPETAPAEAAPLRPVPAPEGQSTGNSLFRVPDLRRAPKDRTTQRPARSPQVVRRAVYTTTVVDERQEQLDAEGWRPARRDRLASDR